MRVTLDSIPGSYQYTISLTTVVIQSNLDLETKGDTKMTFTIVDGTPSTQPFTFSYFDVRCVHIDPSTSSGMAKVKVGK